MTALLAAELRPSALALAGLAGPGALWAGWRERDSDPRVVRGKPADAGGRWVTGGQVVRLDQE